MNTDDVVKVEAATKCEKKKKKFIQIYVKPIEVSFFVMQGKYILKSDRKICNFTNKPVLSALETV